MEMKEPLLLPLVSKQMGGGGGGQHLTGLHGDGGNKHRNIQEEAGEHVELSWVCMPRIGRWPRVTSPVSRGVM